jgi:hypothetical protein
MWLSGVGVAMGVAMGVLVMLTGRHDEPDVRGAGRLRSEQEAVRPVLKYQRL